MSVLTCPHCLNDKIPHGAKVCRGCQAEIEYGASGKAYISVIAVSVVLGVWLGTSFQAFLGWLAFGVSIAGGIYLCAKAFADRVVFKRRYRT